MKSRTVNTLKFCFLYSAFTLFFLGCAPKNTAASEDVILKSYRLIDEQRTDEAITLIESVLKTDGANYELKAVLASAYAHKAGFKIQLLIPLVTLTDNLAKVEVSSKVTEKSNSGIDPSKQVIKLHFALEVFNQIPLFTKEKMVFLNYAIHLLNSLDKEIKSDELIYRALLKTLRLRYKIALYANENTSTTVLEDPLLCHINLASINDYIQDVGGEFTSIVSDIAQSNPDQTETLSGVNSSVANAMADFNLIANSTEQLDTVASALLKQTLLQSDLGALIECR